MKLDVVGYTIPNLKYHFGYEEIEISFIECLL